MGTVTRLDGTPIDYDVEGYVVQHPANVSCSPPTASAGKVGKYIRAFCLAIGYFNVALCIGVVLYFAWQFAGRPGL